MSRDNVGAEGFKLGEDGGLSIPAVIAENRVNALAQRNFDDAVAADPALRGVVEEYTRQVNRVMAERATNPGLRNAIDAYRTQQWNAQAAANFGFKPSPGMEMRNAQLLEGNLLPGIPGAGAVLSSLTSIAAKPGIAALSALDYVWENVVAEPLSAVTIALNHQSGAFLDWSESRDRANEVSFGQAAMSSATQWGPGANKALSVVPGLGLLFGLANAIIPSDTGLDFTDPAVVKAISSQSLAYNLMSGGIDTGLNFMPIPGGKGIGAVRRITGMSNKVLTADYARLADDIAAHAESIATGGAQGRTTQIGTDIQRAAESNNPADLMEMPIFKMQSGASRGRLADLASLTNDYETTALLYRTSIGDTKAAAELFQRAPDLAYDYGRIGEQMQAHVDNLGPLTTEQRTAVDAAFASAEQRDEFARKAIRLFLSDSSGPGAGEFVSMGGWMPMEGKGVLKPVARALEGARSDAGRVRAALNTSDTELLPAMWQRVIKTSSSGPTFRLLNIPLRTWQWSSTYRPLNTITLSGSRPDDIFDELVSRMEQIDGLRFGQEFPVGTAGARKIALGDGSLGWQLRPASELRAEWLARLADAANQTHDLNVAVVAEWRRIEDEIVLGMMRKHGVTDELGQQIIAKVRQKLQGEMDDARQGFSYTTAHGGFEKQMLDPRTVRELADHEYTLPLNEIEQALKASGHGLGSLVIGGLDNARSAFEIGSSIWRSAVLIKPGYTFRNSILEPGVSAVIGHLDLMLSSEGARQAATGVANYGRNTARRAARITAGTVDRRLAKRLNNEYVREVQTRSDWVVRKQQLTDDLANLDRLAADLGGAEPPSVAAKRASLMDDLQQAGEALKASEARLAEIDTRRAAVADRRETRARPITQGEGQRAKNIQGQDVVFDEGFYGPLGDAFRAETSSALTALNTYDPSVANSAAAGIGVNRVSRMRTGQVPVESPNYFGELHYQARRYFSGDPFFKIVLTQPRIVALRWAREHPNYFKALGQRGKDYTDSDLYAAYQLAHDHFPTREAKALVAGDQPYTAGELQRALQTPDPITGKRVDLQPINGSLMDALIPGSLVNRFHASLQDKLAKVWDYLAVQPETRMARWPFYLREFEREWTSRMASLADQGVTLTPAVAYAQRQAARRAAVKNLEHTFYNIRRYRNPVFTLRYLMSFPGAFFNSMYRYLYYLPTRYPGNFLTTALGANAAMTALAVDGNGERVSHFRDAQYLVIPMTGDGSKADPGVRIPVDAVTRIFLDNPSRSWAMAIGVDTALNVKPDLALMMDRLTAPLGDVGTVLKTYVEGDYGTEPGSLAQQFYGALAPNWSRSALEALAHSDAAPAWLRGAAGWLAGPSADEDWLAIYGSQWEHDMAQREKAGLTGPPSAQDVQAEATHWFFTRFISQFASPMSYKFDEPGQLERDVWRQVRDENPDMSFAELQQAYYAKMGGDWAAPYTMSTQKDPYKLNVGGISQEALAQLQEHGALAEELASLDPSLVGLITMGTNGSFSRAVRNNLQISELFPGSVPYGQHKTPEDWQRQFNVDQGFDEYTSFRRQWAAAMVIARNSDDSRMKKALDNVNWLFLHNTDPSVAPIGLMQRNPDWAASYTGGQDMTVIANGFKKALADPSFWGERQNDPQWQLIKELISNRDLLIQTVHGVSDSDTKAKLKEAYTAYYDSIALDPDNGLFQDVWERFFADEFLSTDQQLANAAGGN